MKAIILAAGYGTRLEKGLKELKKLKLDDLKKVYNEREIEPDMAEEFWEPENKKYIIVE